MDAETAETGRAVLSLLNLVAIPLLGWFAKHLVAGAEEALKGLRADVAEMRSTITGDHVLLGRLEKGLENLEARANKALEAQREFAERLANRVDATEKALSKIEGRLEERNRG